MVDFYTQMEFLPETNRSVTISAGDLLLATNCLHDRIWVTYAMLDDDYRCYTSAASKGEVSGDLCFGSYGRSRDYTNSIRHTTELLNDNECRIAGIWQLVPQSVWPEIYEFMCAIIY